MSIEKQIEEMKTALNNYFDNTPMELSFKHENGDTDVITDEKALGVIDSITRQALIPVFCEALYNAGYRKQSEWIGVDERLPEEKVMVLGFFKYVYEEGGSNEYILTMQMSREGKFVAFNCSPVKKGIVTHWMPLPEPPKMKGGAE